MIAQSQIHYNAQVVHLPLLPKWIDAGVLELTPRELDRVRQFYLAKRDFKDCTSELSFEAFDSGGFKLRSETRLLNRACELSLIFHGASGFWEASVVTSIKNLHDTADAKHFGAAAAEIFRDYFNVSDKISSNIARL